MTITISKLHSCIVAVSKDSLHAEILSNSTILTTYNNYYALLGGLFVPFPLMENEPKRSRPELSAPAAPQSGRAPAPRSEVGAKPRWRDAQRSFARA